MTFELGPELEARLIERARQEGENVDLNEFALSIIRAYLDWEDWKRMKSDEKE